MVEKKKESVERKTAAVVPAPPPKPNPQLVLISACLAGGCMARTGDFFPFAVIQRAKRLLEALEVDAAGAGA